MSRSPSSTRTSKTSTKSKASGSSAASRAKPAPKAKRPAAKIAAKPAKKKVAAKPAARATTASKSAARGAKARPAAKTAPKSKQAKVAARKPAIAPKARKPKPAQAAAPVVGTPLIATTVVPVAAPAPAPQAASAPAPAMAAPSAPPRVEVRSQQPTPLPSHQAPRPPQQGQAPRPQQQQQPQQRPHQQNQQYRQPDRRDDRPPYRGGDQRRDQSGRPPQDQRQGQPRPPQQQHQHQPPRSDRAPAPPHPTPTPTPTAAPVVLQRPAAAAVADLPHPPPAGPSHPGRDEIFDRGTRFADLGLRDSVLKGITEAGFEYPTAIQSRIIPVILAGKDVLGQAKTGTGKTAAFGLPLLNKIEKGVPFQALVLVPTRELAIQVATDLRELGRFTPLQILPVYGGQNVKTQANLLSRGPEIIVATPGRVMDMQQRGFINYRNIKAVVLDEVDRMLDIGFRDDIKRILGGCPRERQTVFVSATINSDIEALARSYAHECEKIVASAGSLTVSMVKQWHLPVAPWDKKQLLLHLLTHEEPALTVIFCRTKKTVDNIAEYLMRKGVDCHAIHGDMYQNKRNKVIEQLKAGKLEVLVASDVASRGLDVEGITHVINYDLPEDPDLYVHRIGRTARAGRDGVAWSLVTPEQGALLTQIELLINAEVPKLDYPDFKPGPLPPDVVARQQQDARRIETRGQFNRFSATPAPGAPRPAAAPAPSSSNGPAAPAPAQPRPAAAPPAPDPTRFPGGIVPTMAPPKRMFGRVKTARSMRQGGPPPPLPPAPTPPQP